MDITTVAVSIIVPLLLSVVANGVAWFLMRPQKGKLEAETAKFITDAAKTVVDELQESDKEKQRVIESLRQTNSLLRQQYNELAERLDLFRDKITALEKRVSVLEDENLELRKGGILLEVQVEELGHEPVWRVPRLIQED